MRYTSVSACFRRSACAIKKIREGAERRHDAVLEVGTCARCSEAAESASVRGVSLSNDAAWVSDRNVAIDRGPASPAGSCPGSAVARARLLE